MLRVYALGRLMAHAFIHLFIWIVRFFLCSQHSLRYHTKPNLPRTIFFCVLCSLSVTSWEWFGWMWLGFITDELHRKHTRQMAGENIYRRASEIFLLSWKIRRENFRFSRMSDCSESAQTTQTYKRVCICSQWNETNLFDIYHHHRLRSLSSLSSK